ncbi:class II aldolase/adducin family protein [Nostocaceae cyanobacterium CENA357]|uniref:Class II aldolase/adducin family protein n=1 Tax=Atlanticothrix silvestris CENA357 TaxID=1725252 RepID=A0A8J7HHH0_9CYAN|nr:class II aldolase/adducin family protein [Atlanticothrix silvestris]MBH8555342.1 class II aldolase/adducin family protein [Atlanticothrix silvestris CENA357]
MYKFNRPQPPIFEQVEDERLHRKQRLAATFRLFAKFGFSEGTTGHITTRDPEFIDHFWVNPLGTYFGHIRVSDLILVNGDGDVVKGDTPVNPAAFVIHSQIYQARPDVIAAAHAHSLYAKAWSNLGRLLDPLNQDACSFYEDHALFNDYADVVLDTSQAEQLAKTLGKKKAVILRNHGILTVGHTVDETAWWYISLEQSCQAQLLAEAAGRPNFLSHETARLTQNQLGTHSGGWFNFQPLYDRIVRDQPDLLN